MLSVLTDFPLLTALLNTAISSIFHKCFDVFLGGSDFSGCGFAWPSEARSRGAVFQVCYHVGIGGVGSKQLMNGGLIHRV